MKITTEINSDGERWTVADLEYCWISTNGTIVRLRDGDGINAEWPCRYSEEVQELIRIHDAEDTP